MVGWLRETEFRIQRGGKECMFCICVSRLIVCL